MEKEFVRYDEALALKELGFDEPCLKLWEKTMMFTILVDPSEFKKVVSERYVEAPLYQQAFRWFREKYELLNHLTTHLNPYGEDGALEESYGYRIMFNKDGWKCDVWEELSFFDTHEESELACIEKLIEIVKEKK